MARLMSKYLLVILERKKTDHAIYRANKHLVLLRSIVLSIARPKDKLPVTSCPSSHARMPPTRPKAKSALDNASTKK